jgi:sterol 3beta-glucosyltransferase
MRSSPALDAPRAEPVEVGLVPSQAPITLMTGGSLGDVLPLVAIGRGLRAAGRRVRLAGSRTFAPLAEASDLEFVDLQSGDPVRLKTAEASQGTSRFHIALRMLQKQPPTPASLLHHFESCRGSAAIVVTTISGQLSHIAEALGIPAFYAALHPLYPTRDFPSPHAPAEFMKIPSFPSVNRFSHFAVEAISWELDRKWVDPWRRAMGLGPAVEHGVFDYLRARKNRILFGFSPSVVPRPADWPDDLAITGYWIREPAPWTPPLALARFLEGGDPPVFIGFGSTMDAHPAGLERTLAEGVRATGRRAIVGRAYLRFAGIKPDSKLHIIDEAPYAWLYPRVAAAVHHAGAGTCAEAVRAGIPSVVIPFAAEQRFWADRLAKLGVAPAVIPRAKLNADRLSSAIELAVSDATIRRRSDTLGRRVRTENGVARAVEIILEGIG